MQTLIRHLSSILFKKPNWHFSSKNFILKIKKSLCITVIFSFIFTPTFSIFAQEIKEIPKIAEVAVKETTISREASRIFPDKENTDLIKPITNTIISVAEDIKTDPALEKLPPEQTAVDSNSDSNTDENSSQNKTLAPILPGAIPEKPQDQKKDAIPQMNSNTGALSYSYSINLPKGTGGYTPTLSLNYNSQNDDNFGNLGHGWELSIPNISRKNTHGTQELYNRKDFNSSLDGNLVKVDIQGNLEKYLPESLSTAYNTYILDTSTNIWTLTTKDGQIFIFGANTDSRQDDPNNLAHIYKWMLSSQMDNNSNTITYTYTKNQNAIYPLNIHYAIFDINFLTESRNDDLQQKTTSFSVTNAFRIKNIQIFENSILRNDYSLEYIYSPTNNKSLLHGIKINNTNETSFDYQNTITGWTYDTHLSNVFPIPFLNPNNSQPYGMRVADINGDGLLDVLCSNYNLPSSGCYNNTSKIFLNTGDGWQDVSSTWTFPIKHDSAINGGTELERFADSSYGSNSSYSTGLQLMDINGDGLNDLIRGNGQLNYIYLNNGSGWVYNTQLSNAFPMSFFNNNNQDYGMRVADINGDGLLDVLCSNGINGYGSGCGQTNPKIFLNTGDGWQDVSSTWTFPLNQYNIIYNNFPVNTESFVDYYNNPTGLQILDVNGDGLNDLIRTGNPYKFIYINNGHGWTYDAYISNVFPLTFLSVANNHFDQEYGMRVGDINGDGLSDILCHNTMTSGALCNDTNPKIYINKISWQDVSSTWTFPISNYDLIHSYVSVKEAFGSNYGNITGLQLMDINGDGLNDLIRSRYAFNDVYLNNNQTKVNVLTKITYLTGGITDIAYKSSTKYLDSSGNLLNPNLPYPVQVVQNIKNTDPVRNIASRHQYEYSGGDKRYDGAFDHKFSGFGKVIDKETNFDGSTVYSQKNIYYHQGNGDDLASGEASDAKAKIGQAYRTDILDNSGNILDSSYSNTSIVNIYTETGAGCNYPEVCDSVDMVKRDDNIHEVFNHTTGEQSSSAQSFTYDSNGNMIEQIEYENVSVDSLFNFTNIGETRKNEMTYVCGALAYASAPRCEVSSETLKDNNNLIVKNALHYYDNLPFGQISTGNGTKDQNLKIGYTYSEHNFTFDNYGNLLSDTDPLGNVTSYIYDVNNILPITVTNALGQSKHFSYDFTFDVPLTIIDENNFTSDFTYDIFGRNLTKSINSILLESNIYNDVPNNTSIIKTFYPTSNSTTISISYLDGLGRKIQNKTLREDGQYDTIDTIYSDRGLTDSNSLPYISFNSTLSPATVTQALLTNSNYDVLGRVISTTNALGTSTMSYDLNEMTTTDANGKQKKITTDNFGRLISVTEYLSGIPYTTHYTYRADDVLLNITDALGNVRNFIYDNKGEKNLAEDLHNPTDTNFGVYRYDYDLAGNITRYTNPRHQMIYYTYDTLNRLLTEDSNSTATTDISYYYDSCQNGITKLCNVIKTNTNTSYKYDNFGNIVTENQMINTMVFETNYAYYASGLLRKITYPDSSISEANYTSMGRPDNILFQSDITSTPSMIARISSYHTSGKPDSIIYGNGVITDFVYDSTKMYSLQNQKSTDLAGNIFENRTYSYDAVLNPTNITDIGNNINAGSSVYTYDDLYRLTTSVFTPSAGTPITNSWTYNILGNILTHNANVYAYTGNIGTFYANPHAVTSIGHDYLSYDKSGNLVNYLNKNFSYNYKNEMTSSNTGTISNYLYNQFGSRVFYQNGTHTIYTPNDIYTLEGADKIKQISLGSFHVADVKNSLVNGGFGHQGAIPQHVDTLNFFHTDTLGSTRFVTDENGIIEQSLDYNPFGDIRVDNHSTFNSKEKFIGERFDDDTGLNYLNARYYNSANGQFVSEDPMFWSMPKEYFTDPQQWNSYSYARNNPISLSDPSGKFSISELGNQAKSIGSKIADSVKNLFGGNKATPSIPKYLEAPKNNQSSVGHIRSTYLSVTFTKGADNLVNPKTVNGYDKIFKESSKLGVNSVNFYATTNHASDTGGFSWHDSGLAGDINMVNGIHVSKDNSYAKILQEVSSNLSEVRENFGPFMITHSEKTYTPAQYLKLSDGHQDHIHTSFNQ
ncbi:MAG: FG-GAP-like repeat-containing protein [Candidatus Nomurabacteria bacterium]|nr:FG-GAP-like repeat-containing protein [Candidatus Nomurabacteria bacterium]